MLPAAFTTPASLATVMPSSLAALAGEPNPLGLPPLEHIVVIVVDGLGASSLRARAGHARTLAPLLGKSTTIDAGFPSTTAAGLTTLTTGTTPGEHGMVVHSIANYRGPALSGDITIQTAEVVDKLVDDQGRHVVQVKHKMTNQKNVTMCTGTAEIQLPKKAG